MTTEDCFSLLPFSCVVGRCDVGFDRDTIPEEREMNEKRLSSFPQFQKEVPDFAQFDQTITHPLAPCPGLCFGNHSKLPFGSGDVISSQAGEMIEMDGRKGSDALGIARARSSSGGRVT